MNVQKTIPHHGMTLAHGSFHISETVYVCPSRCRKDGKLVTARSSDLAKLLIPRSVVGYDIMVYVGRERFVQCRQREEIRTDLESRYGIVLSTGEISALGRRFLVYLETLHWRSAPALRAALETDGGWPLHIDATGEDGRGTMVTAGPDRTCRVYSSRNRARRCGLRPALCHYARPRPSHGRGR